MKIKELKDFVDRECHIDVAIVIACTEGKTAKGSKYYSLTLQDSTLISPFLTRQPLMPFGENFSGFAFSSHSVLASGLFTVSAESISGIKQKSKSFFIINDLLSESYFL